MWLRSSSISFDGYRSKIWKVSRRRPVASNETILAIKQVFFFTKVAPIQSITDIVLLDFWLMVVSWMFISSYTTIYISQRNLFFECLYFSEYDIRMSLYVIWLRKVPSIKYLCNWWGGLGRVIQNAYFWVQEEGVSHLMCTYALHLHYLFLCFWQHFFYSVLIYLWKFDFTFTQKRCVHQKRLFFSNDINFCRHEISSF